MRKKYLIGFTLILLCLSIYFVANDQILASSNNEVTTVDELISSNDIFNEAAEKYGVHGMGVSKSEKVFIVQLFEKDISKKEEVKKYFEDHLINIGVNDLKIRVLVYENPKNK